MSRRLEFVASCQLALALLVGAYNWNLIGGLSSLHWPIGALVWVVPFLWVLRSPDAFAAIIRMPLAPLMLWALWYFIAVNWSNDIAPSAAFALGTVSTTLAASWFAGTFGWDRTARVVSLALMVFYLLGLFYRGVTGEIFTNDGRFEGLAFGPTNVGNDAVVMILAGLAGFRGERFLRWLCTGLGCLVIALAVAKTAIIGLIVGLLYLTYQAGGFQRRRGLVTVAAILILVAGTAVMIVTAQPVGTGESANATVDTGQLLTASSRTQIWSITADLVAQRPLFGWGTGSSTVLYGQFVADGWLGWGVTTAHNLWLSSLLEQGLVGTVLFVAAAVGLAVRCRRSPLPTRDAVLIFLLLNSMTEALIQYPAVPLVVLAASAGLFSYPPRRTFYAFYYDTLVNSDTELTPTGAPMRLVRS